MKPAATRIRSWIVVALVLVVLGIFANRLINIQIVNSQYYKNMKDSQYISTQTIKATRGEIVDRNGKPLAVNRMGYDIILDRAYLPIERQNEIILELMHLCERLGETWNDTLPLTAASPYQFKPDMEAEVQRLKTLVGTQVYTDPGDAFSWLVERYKLSDYTEEEQRMIAGVRYGMEQRGFAWNVPYVFATDITIDSVIQIKERSHLLLGVDIAESAMRNYPNGNIAPHLIGEVGPIYAEEYEALEALGYAMDDRVGKSGVEKAFEDLLKGSHGERQIHIGPTGEVVKVVETNPPVAGSTVMLTIDNDMQLLAQEALERQILRLQKTAAPGQGREADSGAVVVLDVKTGEVLAAATYPSYDLETYRKDFASLSSQTEARPLFNRAIQGTYTPGSTFKPVVALTGLGLGEIDQSSVVNCTRVYTFYPGPYQPTCLGHHGNINVLNALRVSCNIFFYDTGRRVGVDTFSVMARELGLGEPTGIEIAEAVGQVSDRAAKEADPYVDEPWYPADTLQSSIGQLYNTFTPLQIANYTATIANRGKRMKVTLVHEVRDYTMGNVVAPSSPEVAHMVNAPKEAFETVITGMVLASGPSGTASDTFGYYPVPVASKTGTPETTDLCNSVFICFAPVDDPQIAIAVVIEKGWHGYTGAPVAKEIFDEYFGLNEPGGSPYTSAAPPTVIPPAAQNPATPAAPPDTEQPAEEQPVVPEPQPTPEPAPPPREPSIFDGLRDDDEES